MASLLGRPKTLVRSASAPRRVLFFATLIAAGSLADPALAQDISIISARAMAASPSGAIQLIALLTVLSIAPSILDHDDVVHADRRRAVAAAYREGTATAPPNFGDDSRSRCS